MQTRLPQRQVVHTSFSAHLSWCCTQVENRGLRTTQPVGGGMLGKRSDAWQSGTTPSFAAGFGSNTHTLPNWRLPPMPEIHDDSLCPSRKCRLSMGTEREKKITAKIAQRAQRQCTGYYCVSIPASGTKHVLRSQLPGLSISASW